MNNKKLLSWKETFNLNKRAYKLLYSECKNIILSRILSVIWSAFAPYVSIYMSSLIIKEIAEDRDKKQLLLLILISLLLVSFTSIISAILSRWRNAEYTRDNGGIVYITEYPYVKKLMDMDYVDVDDTKVHDLYRTIKENRNGGGWGLIRCIYQFEELVSALVTLITGCIITIPLFTSRVPVESGSFVILNNPIFIVLIVASMFLITYLSPMLANKAGSYFALNSKEHNFVNRYSGHYGWLGYEKERASDVRMYRQDILSREKLDDKSSAFCSKGLFAKYAIGPMGIYNGLSAGVSVVFIGVVYLFVCLKAWAGAFGIGEVTRYIGAITTLSGGVALLFGTIGSMRNNAAFLKLIFEFLDIPNNMYQGSLTVEKRRDREYDVEFKNVSFKYPGTEEYVLKNINMKFKVGRRIAVVGRNGSGKTTFIKLMCRLYDPDEGEILLNGIDIRKYNYREYMSIFSIVFQDFKLFSLPLAENVACGTKYDKEKVIECLEKAGFRKRLSEMEEGVETYLYKDFSEKGVDISGGESQKIALARTVYKDAPFMILDEPTAALDPIAESEVYSNFNEIVGDKTAIYISHRLSSCKFCDEILVFDKGEIVQQGSHEELLNEEKGMYHELWYAQAQYYN